MGIGFVGRIVCGNFGGIDVELILLLMMGLGGIWVVEVPSN
jgi:hypothetical protein